MKNQKILKINNLSIITIPLILPFFLIIMITHVSGQATWTSSGPPGGYVTSIAFSVSDPDIVYCGTTSGVYRSADSGETWSLAGLKGISINDISADPEDENLIYAAAGTIPGYYADIHDGFYKSTDGGNTWEKTYHTWVTAIGVDYGNTGTVYFGTKSGEIFKSLDKGENWELIHTEDSGEFMVQINTILVDPEDSANIFVGTGSAKYAWSGYRGFLKSTDGGQTWSGIQLGTTSPDKGMELVVTPEGYSPQTLYIISDGFEGIGSDYRDIVYCSTDKGESWTGLYIPAYSSRSARTLSVDQKNPEWVVIGTNNPDHPLIAANYLEGVYTDISTGLPGREPSCSASSPHYRDIGLVGYSDGPLYRTEDHAETWQSAGKGLHNTQVLDMAVHPWQSETVLATVEGFFPLQKTTDEGMSWFHLAPHFLENFTAIAIDPTDPDRLFIGTCGGNYSGKIYRSDDNGESGVRVDENSMSGRVKGLWIHPGNTDIILALKEHLGSYAGGVRRSSDGGNSWNQTYNWSWPVCLTSDPNNHNHVYMGVERMGYVLYSPDAGITWDNISPGNIWYNVYDIVVDSNSNLYAATTEYEENEKDGIWKMEWKSETSYSWSHIYRFEDTQVTALAIDHRTDPATLYAGTADLGVFVSEDGGESWSEFNDGLGITNITRLEISQSEPYILYAGTNYGGVWSIPLEIMTYSIIALAGENGSISPTGETEVEHGNELVFTIVPDEGFRVAIIIIDGAEIDLASDENWDAKSGQYTFSNVTETHTIEVGFEVATALAEAEALQQLTVYPNPAKDELWVAFDHQGDAEVDLVLLNIHGQVVQQVSISASGPVRHRMPTHDLTPGVYLLTIRGGEVFPVKKVVIEN